MKPLGRRVLLLVPHPDDEVVGCAVAIRRAQARGTRVFALYLTSGVPAAASAWPWRRADRPARVERRRAAAREAAARLAIEPLAFSDWPSRELRRHLGEAQALIARHRAEIGADQLWTPAYEGGHQDHDVTNFLASLFRAETPVLEFAEYNAARGVRANRLPIETGAETVLWLTGAEAAWKAELVALYRSERVNLRHVRCIREVLRPLPEHDYRRPPHPGRLFYERFQWIPFRHPRVDFTSSAEVCAALAGHRLEGPRGAVSSAARSTS
ncbi:MAG TPA: PIG-L family deacetylase [Polyangia bacterium]|nr:PIG-L family deacetylase [Polyangia bacterium]